MSKEHLHQNFPVIALDVQGQLSDGLRAPLIIHAEEEAHQYDEEYTILLADLYEREYPELLTEFLNICKPESHKIRNVAKLIHSGWQITRLERSQCLRP